MSTSNFGHKPDWIFRITALIPSDYATNNIMEQVETMKWWTCSVTDKPVCLVEFKDY